MISLAFFKRTAPARSWWSRRSLATSRPEWWRRLTKSLKRTLAAPEVLQVRGVVAPQVPRYCGSTPLACRARDGATLCLVFSRHHHHNSSKGLLLPIQQRLLELTQRTCLCSLALLPDGRVRAQRCAHLGAAGTARRHASRRWRFHCEPNFCAKSCCERRS